MSSKGDQADPEADHGDLSRVIAYLAKVEPAIQGQNGSGVTFRAACDIVRFGIDDPETVCQILQDYYNHRCQPPWSRAELWHKAEDACQKETRRDRAPSRAFEPPAWTGDRRVQATEECPPEAVQAQRGACPQVPLDLVAEPGIDTDASLAGKPRTDCGNAERLVARHGDVLRYCHQWSKWLHWDGRRWKTDESGEIYRRAKDTALQILMEAYGIDDLRERKAHADWSAMSGNRSRIENMIAMARSEPGIQLALDDMDTHPWLFNCRNGTLDLKTGKLQDHRRDDCITQLCAVDFDPSASCPLYY